MAVGPVCRADGGEHGQASTRPVRSEGDAERPWLVERVYSIGARATAPARRRIEYSGPREGAKTRKVTDMPETVTVTAYGVIRIFVLWCRRKVTG
jgi:hypothetical protein